MEAWVIGDWAAAEAVAVRSLARLHTQLAAPAPPCAILLSPQTQGLMHALPCAPTAGAAPALLGIKCLVSPRTTVLPGPELAGCQHWPGDAVQSTIPLTAGGREGPPRCGAVARRRDEGARLAPRLLHPAGRQPHGPALPTAGAHARQRDRLSGARPWPCLGCCTMPTGEQGRGSGLLP